MNLGNPIAEGNTAKIFLSNNKIVKVFNDFLPETEALYEAEKQKYAYSCGLPVPKIHEVTKINDKQAIVMEYVKGETLGELFLHNQERAEHYLNLSVDVQMEIHDVIGDGIEPMVDKLYRQINGVEELSTKQKCYLLKKLDSFTNENRLCHGDFHLFNLLKTDRHIAIIDWVDSSMGDIRADIYRTYLLYSQFSSDLADLYLELYCKKSGLLKSEVFQWAPIIAAARLSENVSSENSERLMEIVNKYCSY
ncbi:MULTISPECIES: aminoglycoside phosphotransferase family protein [Sutcliffiella]|uniref:Aminoglycoside phosphotransferase n=1 Tax=Sutcliffiella cohnii TaxID=33932 RepID=A0A223KPH2_9BACI|nr:MULTISPECIES: aminoglycoside phosphotransferase family protein [Sutcliffiella]AST91238.1 aminoglycoside phosphotransferase [Sutcliffiella cohnii]MED4018848.1 aminoglycoside phosphotransferase family protein [Sutcliffiella cohnii]WBL17058.1 aminoglycoside phosphotransferase family protein [Sutcliffiella sp. NC1]